MRDSLDRCLSRRSLLRGAGAAAAAGGLVNWANLVCASSDDLRKRGRACILLWMQGGPSQFETFSPRPGHEHGGPTKAIATRVPGIEIAEHFPHLAQAMDDVALIRSVSSKEGNHQRASFFLHTGYLPTGSVKQPTLGSIVAQQIGDEHGELPSFVRIGDHNRGGADGGLLGVKYDPFVVNDPGRKPQNATTTTSVQRYRRRLGLLADLEERTPRQGAEAHVADHRTLYDKAARMITSPKMEAFDIERESESIRQGYGPGDFASGCLMARRLVEAGVTFIEVQAGNWDTHYDNFARVGELAAQVDRAYAFLLKDLKDRGLLDSTLVIWMGEFGRTPKINPRGGRDHFPRAFNVALAGGGIRGGQVIGSTDDSGADVADRPVTVPDLFQTFCKSLAIDPSVENMSSIGRPIKLVDGGQPVAELFG